ncbi:replication associated protein [Amphibola crenata associated bacilladnavirus 1]|uniref:Replication associated protein n=1 Tax=Amphibola crenata associated bacilladnavirus 1 TaxID=1941435 RepID=A0A1P8YT73_9VIRU|nr:replication associated protein [Amphibola crenata associated bacilladnavirus 1]AQA27289.1 replication associated protein [Amphibola crenata associated bacilladnavirus 1]
MARSTILTYSPIIFLTLAMSSFMDSLIKRWQGGLSHHCKIMSVASISTMALDRLLDSQDSLVLPTLDGTIPAMVDTSEKEVDHNIDDATELTDYSEESNQRNKLGRCIVTLFPPDSEPKWLDPSTYYTDPASVVKIWVGQFEITPETNQIHAHIYIEFHHKKRPKFNLFVKMFTDVIGKHVNVKSPKKSNNTQRQGAVNYCMKDETRMPDHQPYLWPGNNPAVAFCQKSWDARTTKTSHNRPSREESVEEQRQWIESKPMHWTWDSIVHECEESKVLLATCSWGQKYHAGRHASTPRRTIRDVVIMYGAGGTGKTTLAHKWDVKEDEDFQQRYYRRNPDDGNFWGGGRTAYKGQRIVHFEEFCGQEPFHRIKEVCDIGKEGPSVNIKNSGTDLNHEVVLLTSNNHPAGWYRNLWAKEHKQFHPFWRRVTQVWFFPAEREDGTPNTPDEHNPPYMIDQTEEWTNMKGDYNACLKSAARHWPLPDLQYTSTDGLVHINDYHPPENKKRKFFNANT